MKVGREPPLLLAGCRPEVAVGPDGRILATGTRARAAAGDGARKLDLAGTAWPGLTDSHIHLGGLVAHHLTLDVSRATSRDAALALVRRWVRDRPLGTWVTGRGWYNDAWPDPAWPHRASLDEAAGGRPALLVRKDGHSAWASTAALALAGIDRRSADPPAGAIDRDATGEPTGILRERALDLVARLVPEPRQEDVDRAMAAVLRGLARLGLTSVHSMDGPLEFACLQRLRRSGPLSVRVTWNLPVAELAAAERMGLRSGWGDEWLRLWGVKAFLDGSLGSRTAEMLDGSGLAVLPQGDLEEVIRRCGRAELNVCLHAIGDGAVRRALDALEPASGAWRLWRPRIEHAQCVHPRDRLRFRAAGVIASMQPIHALADRELADREWGPRTEHAYAWRSLVEAGARLAFGSDAPVETASPLAGLEAATRWRGRVGWHPQLALTPAQALAAYTSGAAYAAGQEYQLGRLRPGFLGDVTVVDGGEVAATVVGGRITWRRRPRATPSSS